MVAVKARGRENTLAGESDAAEREEYRSLKKQIETLEVGSAVSAAIAPMLIVATWILLGRKGCGKESTRARGRA